MGEPHILIVDDARDIREPLSQYLRKHTFRTSLAADAAQARAAVYRQRSDLRDAVVAESNAAR